MLLYDKWIPPKAQDGAPLMVLLHGRGSHMGDLMGLQPHLPQDAVLVAPQAPFPGAPWGYGPGWAWYRFMGQNRPEVESFRESLRQLESFLSELPGRLPVRPGPLVLGGFSQGGVLSMGYALTRPGRVEHCVNFSGFFPDHPDVKPTHENVKGTRFFWGHGRQDPMIGIHLAAEGRALLQTAGADLTALDYPIGHWIDPVEMQDLRDWLREGLAG